MSKSVHVPTGHHNREHGPGPDHERIWSFGEKQLGSQCLLADIHWCVPRSLEGTESRTDMLTCNQAS